MNDKQLEACRAKFQKWFQEDNDLIDYRGLNPVTVFERDAEGNYEWDIVHISWDAWQAAYNLIQADELSNLVIILDDDAEPEPGDFISYRKRDHGAMFGGEPVYYTEYTDVREGSVILTKPHIFAPLRIIQRQGKPVIYRSQLNKQEGGCE